MSKPWRACDRYQPPPPPPPELPPPPLLPPPPELDGAETELAMPPIAPANDALDPPPENPPPPPNPVHPPPDVAPNEAPPPALRMAIAEPVATAAAPNARNHLSASRPSPNAITYGNQASRS